MHVFRGDEFEEGVSGTVLLVERHEGSGKTQQYLSTSKDVVLQKTRAALGRYF